MAGNQGDNTKEKTTQNEPHLIEAPHFGIPGAGCKTAIKGFARNFLWRWLKWIPLLLYPYCYRWSSFQFHQVFPSGFTGLAN